ncbi:hypothetical protein FB451DRAFT_1289980 [Mycena latifolia]|nr:hypothetical protein FB451DRAFT_1289980 [Mycena latifolia]
MMLLVPFVLCSLSLLFLTFLESLTFLAVISALGIHPLSRAASTFCSRLRPGAYWVVAFCWKMLARFSSQGSVRSSPGFT